MESLYCTSILKDLLNHSTEWILLKFKFFKGLLKDLNSFCVELLNPSKRKYLRYFLFFLNKKFKVSGLAPTLLSLMAQPFVC